MMPARFRAAVFEVVVPTNAPSSNSIDAANLEANAHGVDEILKTLKNSGTTRLLCLVDQTVNLAAETIMAGGSDPLSSEPKTGVDGTTRSTVTFMSAGVIFRLSSPPTGGDNPPRITVSTQASAVPGAGRAQGSSFRNDAYVAMLSNAVPLEFDRPFVSVTKGRRRSTAPSAEPFCVVRYEFGKPGTEAAENSTPALDLGQVEFQATEYEVLLPGEMGVVLDAEALTRQAGSPESLLKALTDAGKARIVYHLDEPADIFGQHFQGGSSAPISLISKSAPPGTTMRSVTYTSFGTMASLFAFPPTVESGRKNPDVLLDLQNSSPHRSDVSEGPGFQSTVMRTLALRHSEPLQLNQPKVFLYVRPGITDESNLLASVVRYVYRAPERKYAQTNSLTVADGKLPANFQATIYEVRAGSGKWERLDSRDLEVEGTADGLLKRLNEVGSAEAIFRVDEPVNAITNDLHQEVSQPVTGVQTMGGRGASTTQRMEITTLDISMSTGIGAAPASSAAHDPGTRVSFEMRLPMFDNPQPISGTVAPLPWRTFYFEHSGPIRRGNPVVMLYASTDGLWEDRPAVIYVVRYQFNPPKKN